MAQLEPLSQFILSWEGGFVNDPSDKGGATSHGVTIASWRAYGHDLDGDGDIDEDDVRLVSINDAVETVMRPHYWNPWRADEIKDQNIANICVDWGWASGVKNAVRSVQNLLGVKCDGKVGPVTLAAINAHPSHRTLFDDIKKARKAYIEAICRSRPVNRKFYRGWMRRLDAITWGGLKLNR